MKEKIKHIIQKALASDQDITLFIPEEERFGHYATNVALRVAKVEGTPPLSFATKLQARIVALAPQGFFEKVEVAPPGFINFWLSPKTIQSEFEKVHKAKASFGRGSLGKREKIIVEYSQPNIAKELHVGHFRTTILGDALANIFESLGYKVIRWNYLGDWGTQFGKVIVAYKAWGSEDAVRENPIKALVELYVKFHEEAKRNPKLEEEAQQEFRKLEEGDRENRRLWKWFKKESLIELEKIYKLLGVKFDTSIGESFFENDLKPLVDDLVTKGIAKRSEGALVIPLDANKPPALIQKSDGASLYLTRDIAALLYRVKKYKPERLLYVVGNEQSLHFEQLFAVAKILGVSGTEFVHVKYGLVLDEQGKKLATRAGKMILLQQLLHKAIRLAREIVQEKNPDLLAKEKEEIARVVGIGALKYVALKENRHSDITFNWDKMLDFQGDSGPYLQYTYARLKSILRKAGKVGKADLKKIEAEEELALMRKLFEFPDVVSESAKMLATNTLANYLYKLSNIANKFYETNPILKDQDASRKNARLKLIHMVAMVIKRGLGLLGIETTERI